MTIANNIVAKLAVAFVAVAMAVSLVAPAAQAQTAAELQAMIDSLLAQIASLQAQMGQGGSSSSCTSVPAPLTVGSQGANVTALQNFLISQGQSIPAGATGYFGSQTQAALAGWQAANGVSPAVGYYGPITKAAIDAKCASMGNNNGGSTGGSNDLDGGAGSISDADYLSGLNNEEVGEDQEDVEVAGLEIEADDGSDIELTAVNLNFSPGNAVSDFDKHADEVSIWVDGEEVARVDADEFEDDDNYDKTISLDNGGIIRAGDTGELVVAVSGISNLDSSDAGKTWTVEFESVRFRDAQGASVTDTSTGDINDGTGRTFSFENFATAADLELKVTKGDDDINDARSISVSSTTDTDNVEILSFEIEIEGNSDVNIDDLAVDFATSTGDLLSDLINTAELVVDGDVIGSESINNGHNDDGVVVFDNLDWDIDAGDTVEVIVRVDMNELNTGTFGAGATLSASVDPDNANWDVEDENGDDLGAGDKTGSATSEAHAFYGDGIQVSLNDTSVSEVAGDSNDDDYVTLTIKFDVTAYGSDIYVDKTVSEAGTTTAGTAFGVDLSDNEGTYINAASTTYALSSSVGSAGAYGYEVEEGETETFTLTVTVQNAATSTFDGKYVRSVLTGIGFNTTDSATGQTTYTSRLTDDFKTDYGFIAN